jgi:cytochrome c peroxidase
VLDFNNRGGTQALGISLPTQTLPSDKLNLRKEDKQALEGFMQALTNTTRLTDLPLFTFFPQLN